MLYPTIFKNKKGFQQNAETLARLVPRAGIEPALALGRTGF
jgi:hypothetical protein